ncbi:MAG TPA: hypothetical protein VF170_13305 [Planctomycetaceae bacterium]
MSEQDGYRFEPARFLAWLPVYLLVAFALYVLSAGPLYWAIYEAYFLESDPYLAILYLPLVWLSGQSDLFARWMEWYVGLWVL